jgi:2-keto-4-pentenoate hydratase/2-oxohepta-3-ene-1,7-dioic acid hydratase in catechol pathway
VASDLFPAPPAVRLPVRDSDASFPVRRVYCVGRNFAEHAREMGMAVPAAAARGLPVFFAKPADALVPGGGDIAYPPATRDLHHEVELVVALHRDAPGHLLDRAQAEALVFGYAIGLDLTRRDLQAAAKAKGLPWDTAKGFDHSAPISPLLPRVALDPLPPRVLSLQVNSTLRQQAPLADLLWDVPDVLVALASLYRLRAGDLVFMGTPAGVAALQPGDVFHATLDDALVLDGRIVAG